MSEDREKLAQWMLAHSFATGHGDTLDDLLKELSWQVAELNDLAPDALLPGLRAALTQWRQIDMTGMAATTRWENLRDWLDAEIARRGA